MLFPAGHANGTRQKQTQEESEIDERLQADKPGEFKTMRYILRTLFSNEF